MALPEKKPLPTSLPAANDVFDVRRVRRLVELMKDNDLTELEIKQGDLSIHLQRATAPQYAVSAVPQPLPIMAPPAASTPVSTAVVAPPVAVDESHLVVVKSPMVGTFYAAPNPESPPFVKVGDAVHPEKTVCIIEAMKVFNEIQAEAAGRIVAVLIQSGRPVEFGTPLFKIDTRG